MVHINPWPVLYSKHIRATYNGSNIQQPNMFWNGTYWPLSWTSDIKQRMIVRKLLKRNGRLGLGFHLPDGLYATANNGIYGFFYPIVCLLCPIDYSLFRYWPTQLSHGPSKAHINRKRRICDTISEAEILPVHSVDGRDNVRAKTLMRLQRFVTSCSPVINNWNSM